MNDTRPHILVVDDLPDAADSLAELLALWGYDVEARYGGATALASARVRPPGVVLLDLGMPRMDGFEFVARLRELPGGAQTAVVAVSGYTTEVCRARGRELGISHYLLKPADLAFLKELLGRLTVRPEPRRSRSRSRSRQGLDERPAEPCAVG